MKYLLSYLFVIKTNTITFMSRSRVMIILKKLDKNYIHKEIGWKDAIGSPSDSKDPYS